MTEEVKKPEATDPSPAEKEKVLIPDPPPMLFDKPPDSKPPLASFRFVGAEPGARAEPLKGDFTDPVETWDARKRRDYSTQVASAHQDAYEQALLETEQGKRPVQCESSGRGVHVKECDCALCEASRAAFLKQMELTGYDPADDIRLGKTRK